MLEFGEVAHDLGAGPILGADEFAAEEAAFVDDVGLGQELGAVEGVDAAVGVAHGGDLDVVLEEEAAIDVVGLVERDADDGELRHAALEVEQAGQFFKARGAPGSPEIEDDDLAAELGEVDGLDAIGDGEEGGWLADALRVVAAVAAGGRDEKEGGGEGRKAAVACCARDRELGCGHVPIIEIVGCGLASGTACARG